MVHQLLITCKILLPLLFLGCSLVFIDFLLNDVMSLHVSKCIFRGQFSNGEASKQTVNRRQNVSNISNVEEVAHGSGNWVNPKGKATRKASVKRSVNKGSNKSVKSNTGNKEHAAGNWVEPRISASKKRIQANAQSSGEWHTPSQSSQASRQAGGHWYTGSGGRKVC